MDGSTKGEKKDDENNSFEMKEELSTSRHTKTSIVFDERCVHREEFRALIETLEKDI